MKRHLPLTLVALAVLVTGCPHNEYVVELKPRGIVIERKLTVYREGDNNTNGAPNREALTTNEAAAIKKLYPSGSAGIEADKFVALGLFSGAMPADVGGAGSYTNLTTTLGSAGFYLERFRGEDDLVAMAQRRAQAADQLTDLVIGWAKAELGKEPNFENLRKFLDTNVRHDLKNAGEYIAPFWQYGPSIRSQIPEDATNDVADSFAKGQMMRLGQFLVERGYLKPADLASVVFETYAGNLGPRPLIQKLVASKLGIPAANPFPKSMDFLDNDDAIQASLSKYLDGTEFYRTKLRDWDKNKPPGSSDDKPKSTDFAGELALAVVGIDKDIFGSNDRLTVKLSLPSAPVQSNGKWDETNNVVLWEQELEHKENRAILPVLCYAAWSQPDEASQKKHFGRTVLTGKELVQYCLWRSALNTKQAAEWDALVNTLQPGTEAMSKLEAFKFSGEPPPVSTAAGQPPQKSVVIGAMLLKAALDSKPDGG